MLQILKENCIMKITDAEELLRVDLKLTEAERLELKRAREMPTVFDEDCPETTPEMALKFRRVNPSRK